MSKGVVWRRDHTIYHSLGINAKGFIYDIQDPGEEMKEVVA